MFCRQRRIPKDDNPSTPGFHLIALNARIDDRDFTGDRIGQSGDNSPPVVAHDTIFVGALLPESA